MINITRPFFLVTMVSVKKGRNHIKLVGRFRVSSTLVRHNDCSRVSKHKSESSLKSFEHKSKSSL